MTPRVVVVGGGLAGLTAALACADAGAEVVVLEARPRLGGATASFRREFAGTDAWLDTGQHVFLRCCTAYRGFLARVGMTHHTRLQRRLDVPVLLARGDDEPVRARLARSRLPVPAPLHLTGALLGYAALPARERVGAALAAVRLGRLDPTDPAVDGTSFGAWLAARGQGPAATAALWELLTVATLNAPAADASLGLAATVVRRGLLESAAGGDIGWPTAPLQQIHGDAAAAALRSAGATVRTGAKVGRIVPAARGWRVDGTAGPLDADAVVLAVPPGPAADLLPGGGARFAELGTAPIVNVHVAYDRQVMRGPFLAAVGSPVQWVFDRTSAAGIGRGQYLAVSLSAADEWITRPAAQLRDLFVRELARLLPAARTARVLDVVVTRERAATFRQAPGSLALRPPATTDHPGLALAGAWTDTGWPATMEGAVRSGLSAAKVVLADLVRVGRPGAAAPAERGAA